MDRHSNQLLPRIIIVILVALILAASVVLVLALTGHFGSAPADGGPTASVSPTFVPETPVPTAVPTPEPTAEPTPSPTPEPTPVPVELPETEDAGQEYIDRIVFLGDSTTYWLYGYGVLPHTQVWTDSIGTMSLFNWEVDPIAYYDPASPDAPVSLLIPDCAARRKPDILVITLGLNGIALLDETEFRDYYTRMLSAIQQASPDTKIICQSIFPVDDSQVPRGISNAGINAANGWIRDMAEQMGVHYLNSHDTLMGSDGGMRPEYDNNDGMGIHMDTDGLNAMLMYVRTHAWQ